MSDPEQHVHIEPPRRVEILSPGDHSRHWKAGQYGYAIAYSTWRMLFTEHGSSPTGELKYLISKTKSAYGGGSAEWFTANALRFTTRAPRAIAKDLAPEELVAVDFLVEGGTSADRMLVDLVPDAARRAHVRAIVDRIRSLTKR